MARVVEEHPLVACVAAARDTEPLDVVDGGVQGYLVLGFGLPPLVLLLEGLADGVQGLLGRH